MSQSPWPAPASGNVLFILDASHKVDEQCLRNWLATEQAAANYDGVVDSVVVPIARAPEHIPTQALARQLTISPDTLIAPLRVVWSTSVDAKNSRPRLRDLVWGNPRRPGAARARRVLKNNPERCMCIAAAPATLGELRERYAQRFGDTATAAQLADFVAGQASLALDIAERRLRGSRYKVPRQVAKNLQASSRFKIMLQQLSAEQGTSMHALHTEAGHIMKELISIPRTFWLDVMGVLNRRIINLGYETDMVIDQEGLERIRRLTREHPSALLWTHKTHVDGFAMHSMLLENDFPAPHILGGVNMAFAGLGFLARRAGAIFIRRSFQDSPLYKNILRQYIGYLLEKRFPLTWAFEGTRSRVGKLMPPRYGLLKYVVEAAYSCDAQNLHIIPVAINYDLIGDVRDYATEQAGAKKRPESLRWFIGYLRGLRQPMGRIYVDFGEPVVLAQVPSPDDTLALQKIAFQVGVEVNKVTPITMASLVATVLLGAAPRALTRDELVKQIEVLVRWAKERGIRVSSDLAPENQAQMTAIVEVLINSGMLTRYDGGPERVYLIAQEQHGVANYYRNTTIHHFVNKAILEVALLHVAGLQGNCLQAFWDEAERVRDLFKFEFFYAPKDEFKVQVRDELQRYDGDWEAKLSSQAGFAQQLLSVLQPLLAHTVLLSFVEAYRVVADVLARQADDASLDEKDCVAQGLAYGRQAYLQRRISSEASIGKQLFENGYKLLANKGLVEAGDAALGLRRRALSQDLRELAHRLDIVRTIALPR